MTNNFESLKSYDVISINFEGEDTKMFLHPTFRVSDLLGKINDALYYEISEEEKGQLLGRRGILCEVLKSGAKGWQKGRVRLNLEFCPDEVESPLDDIRQKLNNIEQ